MQREFAKKSVGNGARARAYYTTTGPGQLDRHLVWICPLLHLTKQLIHAYIEGEYSEHGRRT